MLPKFILADNFNHPEKIYVIHTQDPKFVVESDIEDFYQNQQIHWINEKEQDTNEIKSLLKAAEDYYEEEFDKMEALFDEEDYEEEEK